MPRYEYSEGTSNKFWDIAVTGTTVTTTYGRIGSAGQTTVKALGDAAAAKKEYDKLVAEKTKKGYRLGGGGSSAAKAATPAAKAATPAAKAATPAASAGMYFELVDGSSSKFWEIVLDDASFVTRYGKIGTDGQKTIKAFKTAGEAKAEHDKLVAEKTKKGYELVSGTAPSAPIAHQARDAKLEARIAAAPDDSAAYSVYGDWLQSQGDLRGELIALQVAGKKAAADKLIAQNAAHFYGKAADALDLLAPKEDWRKKHVRGATTWRWGYLESLWIANNFDRSGMHDGAKPEVDVAEVLGWLLDNPSTAFLRALTVGIVTFEDNGYDGIAKVLGKHALPSLHTLYLGDFVSEDTELNWSHAGDISSLYAAVPELRKLTVRSGTMKLGKHGRAGRRGRDRLDLPALEQLVIVSGGLDRGSLASICKASWPALEILSVQLGRDGEIAVKDVQPILDAKGLAKVRHLGLGNSTISDAVCAALATSRIAAQLESLDLSKGTMGDAGAQALATGRFPKLTTIDVSNNYLTKAGIAALEKLAKTVVVGEQEDDGGDAEDRYISAYE